MTQNIFNVVTSQINFKTEKKSYEFEILQNHILHGDLLLQFTLNYSATKHNWVISIQRYFHLRSDYETYEHKKVLTHVVDQMSEGTRWDYFSSHDITNKLGLFRLKAPEFVVDWTGVYSYDLKISDVKSILENITAEKPSLKVEKDEEGVSIFSFVSVDSQSRAIIVHYKVTEGFDEGIIKSIRFARRYEVETSLGTEYVLNDSQVQFVVSRSTDLNYLKKIKIRLPHSQELLNLIKAKNSYLSENQAKDVKELIEENFINGDLYTFYSKRRDEYMFIRFVPGSGYVSVRFKLIGPEKDLKLHRIFISHKMSEIRHHEAYLQHLKRGVRFLNTVIPQYGKSDVVEFSHLPFTIFKSGISKMILTRYKANFIQLIEGVSISDISHVLTQQKSIDSPERGHVYTFTGLSLDKSKRISIKYKLGVDGDSKDPVLFILSVSRRSSR